MIGAWDQFGWKDAPPTPPSDETTFRMAEAFLKGLAVEDWGCGTGWFKTIHNGPYVGVDGSKTPAVDVVADLTRYRAILHGIGRGPQAILLRHVLEHNRYWETILSNAGASFERRLAIVLFTPWSDTEDGARVLGHAGGISNLALPRGRFYWYLDGLLVEAHESLRTNTQYGVEHVFLVEKP